MNYKGLGIAVPRILVPDDRINMKKWSVIACDQHVTDSRYWEEVERTVGGSPSTLRMMLPEAYLSANDCPARIRDIKDVMYDYIESGILQELPDGFILVERIIDGKPRKGLIVLLDLEEYEYDLNKKPVVRPTEQTLKERIPPRIQIRMDAIVEMPHAIALIDAPNFTVIDPVWEKRNSLKKLYGFDLMMDGGEINGYFVNDFKLTEQILHALSALPTRDGMRICIGDGNHSIATAKEIWNKQKLSMTEEERATSPLRYAMAELINLHDPALKMLPIHRAMLNTVPSSCLQYIVDKLNQRGLKSKLIYSRRKTRDNDLANCIYFNSKDSSGRIEVANPEGKLLLEDLQIVLEQYVSEFPTSIIDYVHGIDELERIGEEYDTLTFMLNGLTKQDFFSRIIECGVLPKKCFSLGEAAEKRYYLECRLLVEPEPQPEEELPAEKEETAADSQSNIQEEAAKDNFSPHTITDMNFQSQQTDELLFNDAFAEQEESSSLCYEEKPAPVKSKKHIFSRASKKDVIEMDVLKDLVESEVSRSSAEDSQDNASSPALKDDLIDDLEDDIEYLSNVDVRLSDENFGLDDEF